MDTHSPVHAGNDILDMHLFEIGETPVSVATVIVFALCLVLTWWLARLMERGVRAAMRAKGVGDEGGIKAIGRLVHYVVMLVGFAVGFETAGFQLSALFAAGAVFAVGVGFALQNLAQNFMAGVILLVERSITPGDILEVEGRMVRVKKMNMRTTVARTRDEEDLIIPNATLVLATVKNYSLDDAIYRLRVSVGVDYSSDMQRVRTVLEEVAETIPWRRADPPPRIEMSELGASAVTWDLSVWMDDPWRSRPLKAEVNERIWFAFKEAGIQIPLPQVQVSVDAIVVDALTTLARRGEASRSRDAT